MFLLIFGLLGFRHEWIFEWCRLNIIFINYKIPRSVILHAEVVKFLRGRQLCSLSLAISPAIRVIIQIRVSITLLISSLSLFFLLFWTWTRHWWVLPYMFLLFLGTISNCIWWLLLLLLDMFSVGVVGVINQLRWWRRSLHFLKLLRWSPSTWKFINDFLWSSHYIEAPNILKFVKNANFSYLLQEPSLIKSRKEM